MKSCSILAVSFITSPTLFEGHGIYDFPSKLADKIKKGDATFKYGALTAGKWVNKRDVYFLSTLYLSELENIERRAGGSREEEKK